MKVRTLWDRIDDASDAIRSVLLTILIILANVFVGFGLFYGIPAIKSWGEANRATVSTYREEIPELVRNLNETSKNIKEITSKIPTALDTSTGDLHEILTTVNRDLRELRPVLANLNQGVTDTRRMINDTNIAINHQLLPEITATAAALKTTPDKVNQAISELTAKTTITFDDIHAIMADPSWKLALSNIEKSSANMVDITASTKKTSENIAITTGQIAEASKQMPSIAANVEKISKTTSRYSKAVILTNIFSTLLKALIP